MSADRDLCISLFYFVLVVRITFVKRRIIIAPNIILRISNAIAAEVRQISFGKCSNTLELV